MSRSAAALERQWKSFCRHIVSSLLHITVCSRHQKYMNAAKHFSSSVQVGNLEVSDLCRIQEFCTAAQQGSQNGEYRGEQSGASGCAFRRTVKVSAGNLCFSDPARLIREFGVRLECNREL